MYTKFTLMSILFVCASTCNRVSVQAQEYKDLEAGQSVSTFWTRLDMLDNSDVLNTAVKRFLSNNDLTGNNGLALRPSSTTMLTSNLVSTVDFDTLQAQFVTLAVGVPTALSVPFQEDSAVVQFTSGFSFPFYGESYLSTFAGFNGSLGFGTQDTDSGPKEVSTWVSGFPKVSGAYGNFTGTSFGGSITATQLDTERVLFEYRNISGDTSDNNWNVTLYNSGQIDLSYPGVINEPNFILGTSGGGTATFEEVNFLNPPSGSGSLASIYQVASDGNGPNAFPREFNLEGYTVSLFPNSVGSYDWVTQAIPEPSVGLLSSGSLALLFLGMSRALPGRKRAKK